MTKQAIHELILDGASDIRNGVKSAAAIKLKRLVEVGSKADNQKTELSACIELGLDSGCFLNGSLAKVALEDLMEILSA